MIRVLTKPQLGDIITPDFLLPMWRCSDGRRFGFALFGGWQWFFIGFYTPVP